MCNQLAQQRTIAGSVCRTASAAVTTFFATAASLFLQRRILPEYNTCSQMLSTKKRRIQSWIQSEVSSEDRLELVVLERSAVQEPRERTVHFAEGQGPCTCLLQPDSVRGMAGK